MIVFAKGALKLRMAAEHRRAPLGRQLLPDLAQLAVQETGFGNVNDKITKNRFASRTVLEVIKSMKTVGILKEEASLCVSQSVSLHHER